MLIQFIDDCSGVVIEPNSRQIPIWPNAVINAGEVGLVLKSVYYKEVGTICEVLIGGDVFFDVPRSKFQQI